MLRSSLLLLVLAPALAAAGPLEDGKLLLKKRQYKEAIIKLGEAASTDATDEAAYCIALAYELSGDAVTARTAYAKVVEKHGAHATDAKRSLDALESIANEDAAVAGAASVATASAADAMARISAARERADAAAAKLSLREAQSRKAKRDEEDAAAELEKAKQEKSNAEQILAELRGAAFVAPSGRGRALRIAGTALLAVGGAALGASAWYARMASDANDAINHNETGSWSPQLNYYVKWGETSNARLPVALPLGGVTAIAGVIALRIGEGAVSEPADKGAISTSVEAGQ